MMATSKRLGALLIAVFMSIVGQCFAHPSFFDVDERPHVRPYWSDRGRHEYDHGEQISSDEPSSRDLDIGFTVSRDDDEKKLRSHTSREPIRGGYDHGEQISSDEPSSRDLDIGFTVSRDDDEKKLRSHTSRETIRGGYVASEGHRERRPEDFNIDVFADRTDSRYASSEGRSRGFYPPRSDGWMGEDEDGYPGVIAQPLDYKAGEFKLRSDRGYQLSMHVPPSSVGDHPGVLKIDMKATLYRPIYY